MGNDIATLVIISIVSIIMFFLTEFITPANYLICILFALFVASLLFNKKMVSGRTIPTVFLAMLIFLLVNAFYFQPAIGIAKGYGTVLSDNWFNALTWIKENTEECSTIATYWDPGHFITGIARRPVVFDGASQGALWTKDFPGRLSEQEIRQKAVIDSYTSDYKIINGTDFTQVTTSRIQDIATVLFTANESLALEILKKFRKPGCKELYFIASSDLISKSVWWTYFSTWKPETKGKQYSYSLIRLTRSGQTDDGGKVNIYAMNSQQSMILYENGQVLKALIQEGGNVVEVKRVVYFRPDGMAQQIENKNATFPGLVWVPSDKNIVVYVPPEIENSIFTKMFLFDGFGLKGFELINSWGGEIKLFRVNFTDLPNNFPI